MGIMSQPPDQQAKKHFKTPQGSGKGPRDDKKAQQLAEKRAARKLMLAAKEAEQVARAKAKRPAGADPEDAWGKSPRREVSRDRGLGIAAACIDCGCSSDTRQPVSRKPRYWKWHTSPSYRLPHNEELQRALILNWCKKTFLCYFKTFNNG